MIGTIFKYLKGKFAEGIQKQAAAKGKPHKCMYLRKDVMNLAVAPKCTICGVAAPDL